MESRKWMKNMYLILLNGRTSAIDQTNYPAVNKTKVPVLCSQRWILAYFGFFGFCVAFALRDNINVAIVCMVKTNITSLVNETNSAIRECIPETLASADYNDRAEFNWDTTTKSAVLASFFYGYIVTQIPGGWLADRYGGKLVLGYALLTSAILTILMPVCSRTSVYLVCLVRALMGLMQAVTVPAMHSMWSRWAPVLERSKLTTLCYAGTGVGSTLTLFLSGLLCNYGFDNGWGSVFYLTGVSGVVWAAVWFYATSNSPDKHPRISLVEKTYIESNTYKSDNKNLDVPWISIAKSPCVWACMMAHVCCNWTNYTLSTNIPSFMRAVLKFDIKQNGALSAIPYIGRFLSCIFAGHLADALRSRKVLSTTSTRKLMQAICVTGSQVCLLATGFCSCEDRILAVVLLSCSVTFTGFERAGFFVNHIDFAQRYAGILFGITNTVATVPGMVAPIIAGLLTKNNTREEWRNVFYVCAAIDVFGMLVFVMFGSGEIQEWAKGIQTKTASVIQESEAEMPVRRKGIASRCSVDTKLEPVENHRSQEMNMKLKYGVINLAFEIQTAEETNV